MDVDLDDYSRKFIAWWRNLQPTWRHAADGALSRTEPEGKAWTTLAKGGTSGLYVVVMALSWWIRALDDGDTTSEVWSNISDVCWAIRMIRNELWPSLKRDRDDETPEQGNNKYVVVLISEASRD